MIDQKAAVAICKGMCWSLGWEERTAYLHLEASELMEAVRANVETLLKRPQIEVVLR